MQKLSLSFAILTAVLIIVFLFQPLALVEVVEANPYMFLQFTRIQINSPQYHVYVSSNVDISFDYFVEGNSPQVDSFSYGLDSNPNSALESSKSSIPQINFIKYSVFKTLENLPNDNHKLIVYAHFSNNTVSPIMNRTIVVDTNFIQPKPIILSPLNTTTYNTRQISVTYSINAKIISSAYTLDTSEYAPEWINCGNITLSNLTNGSHKLKISLVIQPHAYIQPEHYFDTVYFYVESNGASFSQTITPSPAHSSTVDPFPVPTQIPEFPAILAITFLSITVLAVAVVFRRKK